MISILKMRSTIRHEACMQAAYRSKWATSTDKHLSILGVDTLNAGFMQPAIRLSILDDTLNWHVNLGRRFLATIVCFLAFLHGKCTSIVEWIVLPFCLSYCLFQPNFWHSPSLNLRSMHCTLYWFSVDMPHFWSSHPVELTDHSSLHAFKNNSKTFLHCQAQDIN